MDDKLDGIDGAFFDNDGAPEGACGNGGAPEGTRNDDKRSQLNCLNRLDGVVP